MALSWWCSKCKKIKYIWRTQQQSLISRNHDPVTQDNPQDLIVSSFIIILRKDVYICAMSTTSQEKADISLKTPKQSRRIKKKKTTVKRKNIYFCFWVNCPFKGDGATREGRWHTSRKKCSTGYIFTYTDSCLTRAQTAGGSLQLSERFREKAHH